MSGHIERIKLYQFGIPTDALQNIFDWSLTCVALKEDLAIGPRKLCHT